MEKPAFIDGQALSALLEEPQWSEKAHRYLEPVLDYARCVAGWYFDNLAAATIAGSEPRAYQTGIGMLDETRTAKHERAISSLSVLNNLAQRAGTAPVFVGDIDGDRKAVTIAIAEFCIGELLREEEGIRASGNTLSTL